MFSSDSSQVSNSTTYIEDVFSTWLYTGTGTTNTITNGIDLSTKGGMVWTKGRNTGGGNTVFDTARGITNWLTTDATDAQDTSGTYAALDSYNNNGFTIKNTTYDINNYLNNTYVSWTFRKQAKFFDLQLVSSGGATFSFPDIGTIGCVIVKETGGNAWEVWHRSLSGGNCLTLNTTNAQFVPSAGYSISVSGTNVTLGSSWAQCIVYVFAHNAGGFGLSGTDNVISCGSYTGSNGAGQTVNVGFEPQWLLVKNTSRAGQNWVLMDVMRQFDYSGYGWLYPNSSAAEAAGTGSVYCSPTATGFKTATANAAIDYLTDSYIYIAIRRGPMKVPTDSTKVFKPLTYTGNGSTQSITGVGFPPSAVMSADRNGGTDPVFIDKLRGVGLVIRTPQTFAESSISTTLTSFDQNGVTYGLQGFVNGNTVPYLNYMFQRAPSFFDEVCYAGTGSSLNVSHNLGAIPELMIIKKRSATSDWNTFHSFGASTFGYMYLNTVSANAALSYGASYIPSAPTSSVFNVGTNTQVNASAATYVAYLFATCPGVSKVGSYTGTGTLTTINCGFTGGARFVLIKRTDSTSNWFVWDTARGMVAGTDPSLSLNVLAAESNANSVYTASTGFQLLASPSADVNTSGGTYIYLAIA